MAGKRRVKIHTHPDAHRFGLAENKGQDRVGGKKEKGMRTDFFQAGYKNGVWWSGEDLNEDLLAHITDVVRIDKPLSTRKHTHTHTH